VAAGTIKHLDTHVKTIKHGAVNCRNPFVSEFCAVYLLSVAGHHHVARQGEFCTTSAVAIKYAMSVVATSSYQGGARRTNCIC
jgi:uncharacterized beta-barrel protein YwiB (DUF1934 family)